MEAGILQFDPHAEFKVIETIEFEEEISRPESLRFFTLDEQLSDYFDKSLPTKGKVTKFEFNKLSNEVDRLREIYENVITVTDTDYIVDSQRKTVNVDWVNPIYTKLKLTPYPYAVNWNPLYKPETRSTPNYYARMLAALPKPYKTVEQKGVGYKHGGILVDEDGNNPINTLPIYERTKGVVRDDGSFTVIGLPVLNTEDDVKVHGFYIQKRPFDIPNPLPEHPFFASNDASRFITNEPLINVFPTVEAIMTHGIPKTSYPNTEGKKLLKIYDLTLSQIPWNLWKDKFPPVDTISVTPNISSIDFNLSDDDAPSKNLQEIYVKKWFPGIAPRLWLSRQEDTGAMVVKMLLSKLQNAEPLAPAIGEKPVPTLIESTPEQCLSTENFETFLSSGVYRPPSWKDVSDAIDKHKSIPLGYCVPIAQIMQEKSDLLSNKIAWKETIGKDILTEHTQLLKFFQFLDTANSRDVFEKSARRPDSETRRQIVAVLKDEIRLPIDRADAISKLLIGSSIKNNLHFDSLDNFLICEHTLSDLRGDLEDDSFEFYEKWATVDEGFRCCKFCGERLDANVYATQDDFDEDGNVIITRENLDLSSPGLPHAADMMSDIQKLKGLFNLENSSEAILYLLISLVQVFPSPEQLTPLIQTVRNLSISLQSAGKGNSSAKQKTEGVLGVVGMVIMLLTHDPFLIPRRSFGSKVLKLTGFPRDTADENDSPALNTVISILKSTFESSPSTFKGSVAVFLRYVITTPKKVREEALKYLGKIAKAPKFQTQFLNAKRRYEEEPKNTTVIKQIVLPFVRVNNPVYSPRETNIEEHVAKCGVPKPNTYLNGKLPPKLVQDPVILTRTKPSSNASYIESSYQPPKLIVFTEAEIQKRVNLGFPKMKSTVMDKINAFLKSDTDANSFFALLNRLLDILSLESFSLNRLAEYRNICVYMSTTLHKSLVRDAVRGVIYELMQEVHKDYASKLAAAIQRDLVFGMILLTKDQASKQETDLRTREREVFKQRMRTMNDTEREATKMLLDIGIAPYIITNEDRELFAREYKIPDPVEEYERMMKEFGDNPEDGFFNPSQDRDDGEPNVVGSDDYGAFTDNAAERYDRDYENFTEEDDGYGVV